MCVRMRIQPSSRPCSQPFEQYITSVSIHRSIVISDAQITVHKGHDLMSWLNSANAVITIAIRLRHDYDPTTTYRARLLPFDAIRREQKMNMSIFRRSRIVVESQLWYRLKMIGAQLLLLRRASTRATYDYSQPQLCSKFRRQLEFRGTAWNSCRARKVVTARNYRLLISAILLLLCLQWWPQHTRSLNSQNWKVTRW